MPEEPLHFSLRAPLSLPCSPGEFLDRYTILRLKASKLADRVPAAPADPRDPAAGVFRQLRNLDAAWPLAWQLVSDTVPDSAMAPLVRDTRLLGTVHARLWETEDEIRRLHAAVHGAEGLDGPLDRPEVRDYLYAARRVYELNDWRHRVKARIDRLFGVAPEHKAYAAYTPADLEEDDDAR